MAEKEKSSKKDVDALLTEVASAAGVPKKAAKPTGAAAAPAKAPALAARAPAKAAAPEAGPFSISAAAASSVISTIMENFPSLENVEYTLPVAYNIIFLLFSN